MTPFRKAAMSSAVQAGFVFGQREYLDLRRTVLRLLQAGGAGQGTRHRMQAPDADGVVATSATHRRPLPLHLRLV